MSKDGFDNEHRISAQINNVKFKNLPDNFKKVIKYIDNRVNDETIILSNVDKSNYKKDITVTINNINYGISIKKGSGNSVHQEPIDKFITYIKNELKAPEILCDYIRLYIWGDGTKDGSGNKKNRISAIQFNKIYPEVINAIQQFFDENVVELLSRFLILGVDPVNKADYIYYGDEFEGKIVRATDAIDYLKKIKLVKKPHIGGLSFQAWNRNINGGTSSENKRGQIQIKWSHLKDDINNI